MNGTFVRKRTLEGIEWIRKRFRRGEPERTCYILSLSDDVLYFILLFLDVPDLMTCSSLCRRFRHVIVSRTRLWREKAETLWKEIPPSIRTDGCWRDYTVRRHAKEAYLLRTLYEAKPYEVNEDCPNLTDKIYSSCWIDGSTLITGTKDNKLVYWDVDAAFFSSSDHNRLPSSETNYVDVGEGARALARAGVVEIMKPPCAGVSLFNTSVGGIHCLRYDEETKVLLSGGGRPDDFAVYHVQEVRGECDQRVAGCGRGEHTLQGRSRERVRETRKTYQLRPTGICYGHTDWVFSMGILPNARAASASRDGTVCVWDIASTIDRPDEDGCALLFPKSQVVPRTAGAVKIRALVSQPTLGSFSTVTSSGVLSLWDMETVQPLRDWHQQEHTMSYSLAFDAHVCLATIGVYGSIVLVDPRSEKESKRVDLPKNQWFSSTGSVRSIDVRRNIVTCGLGSGAILFYDIRADRFLMSAKSVNNPSNEYHMWELGHGFRRERPTDDVTAAFTVSYNPANTALFAGGGPLHPLGIGFYAGMWSR
eukprot:Rmarinus@m.3018